MPLLIFVWPALSPNKGLQRLLPAVLLLLAGALLGAPANALERHLPQSQKPSGTNIHLPTNATQKASHQPLGVDLAGIHFIYDEQPVSTRLEKGLSGLPRTIAHERFSRALTRFLGQPLSVQLVFDIQAGVSGVYRENGQPFVSVTLPPQEVTSGVLQLRIIPFRVGVVEVPGTTAQKAKLIRQSLRIQPGDTIDAAALSEDLEWLNRSPFLSVGATFEPGEQTGKTNVQIATIVKKPFSAYAGWLNDGGQNRFYVGGDALLAPLNGGWVSYQLTASPDAFANPSRLVPTTGAFPEYVGHSARLVIPTAPRQQIEMSPVLVGASQTLSSATKLENTTLEVPVFYRSAVSNLVSGHYWGEVYTGVELKALHRTTLFNDLEVASGDASLVQFVLGWKNQFNNPLGSTSIDARIVANPGGILAGNSDANWSSFTNGKVTRSRYAYAMIDLAHRTPLPLGLGWISRFSGLWSNAVLPDTERMALGGSGAVRGYASSDANVDAGFVWRNELRLPASTLVESGADTPDSFSPYLFADVGFGLDRSSAKTSALAGIGAGVDYTLGKHLSAGAQFGYALRGVGTTSAGSFAAKAHITFRF